MQIFIERQSTNAVIKLDGMPEALFRLLQAARDARVAGKIEDDQATLGCIACARSRMASAFSTLSVRLTA